MRVAIFFFYFYFLIPSDTLKGCFQNVPLQKPLGLESPPAKPFRFVNPGAGSLPALLIPLHSTKDPH